MCYYVIFFKTMVNTSCVVSGCNKESYPGCGISFHRLPSNVDVKKKWIAAIPGKVTNNSVICSLHFKPEDYLTEARKKMKSGVVPSIFPKVSRVNSAMRKSMRMELVSEDLKACRACLATHTRLYSISDGLEHKFVELMGVNYSEDDGLPQHLCMYCRTQLLRFANMRVRCTTSQEVLKLLLEKQPYVSTDDISTIDRNFYKLSLNLGQLGVYTFNSNEKKTTKHKHFNSMAEDRVNDEEMIEIKTEMDPLDGNISENEELDHDQVTEPEEPEEAVDAPKPEGLFVEIDGLNGQIKIKNNAEIENEQMRKEFKKQQAEKVEKKKKEKTAKITNLIRFVVGKKRNEKPLTKWQMQLRRAENNYLPNFDHAEFESKHECKIQLLTMEEQLAEIEERKQSSNYLNLDYKCEKCGRGFEFEQPYRNHMAKHDPSVGKFVCEVCHVFYRTQYLRHRHLDYHKMKFTCSICSFVTRAKHLARNHYLMHTGKVFKCKQCDATFTKSTSYLGHVRLNHPSKDAACEICGDSFVGALGLRHHKAKAHKELAKKKFKCRSCGVQFASSEVLDKHINAQVKCDASKRVCLECGESFSSEELLKAHADETHLPIHYWCEECDQTFLSQASYDTHHQRVHLKIKWPAYGRTREMNKEYYKKIKERIRLKAQVVCEICGAKLPSNAALDRHQQSQCKRDKNTKSYKCPYCEKMCATRQGLQLHTTLHTGEKPYKCGECPLAFRQAGALKRHHKGVHLGIDMRVSCAFCSKPFSTPSARQLHVRTVHLRLPPPQRRRRGGETRQLLQ